MAFWHSQRQVWPSKKHPSNDGTGFRVRCKDLFQRNARSVALCECDLPCTRNVFEALIGIECVAESSPNKTEITSVFYFIRLFPFDQLALEDGVVNLHRNSMMSMDMLRVSDLKQREEKRVSNKQFLRLIKNF